MTGRNHNLAGWGWGCAAIVLIAIAGAIIGAILRRPPADERIAPPPQQNQAKQEKTPAKLPVPLLPLDRAQLLAASAAAADSVASGRPLAARNAAMAGRTFVIRLPFGCEGPQADMTAHWAGWSYNPKTSALKLWARPESWEDAPWIPAIARKTPFEAVEGFWIRRPWTNAETCPPGSGQEQVDAQSSAPEEQTIGIAQFFAPDAPRSLQRGSRPYAVTLKADDNEIIDAPRPYQLIVSGRVVGFDDGQPVHCWNQGRNLRPICLIAVEFSRVAFEDPVNGRVLSEWRN